MQTPKVLFNLSGKQLHATSVAYFSSNKCKYFCMKSIFTLFSLSLLFMLSAFKPRPAGLDEVVAALNSGNASELAKYIDDNIEINLPDKSDNYSRTQAVMILRDFFTNNGVKSFAVLHKGSSGDSGQFCVGTLYTKSGNYRTTIFMKTKNGQQLVREIRFQST